MTSTSGLTTDGTEVASKRRARPAMWLVKKLGHMAPERKAQVQRALIRKGYQAVNKRLEDTNQNCMNYGYASLEGDGLTLDLPGATVLDKFGLQLYDRIASAVDLTGKEVLEVGCGRGAGTEYISTNLKAAKAVGLDLSPMSIDWCNRHHAGEGRSFTVGDAESLDFPAGSFDAVVNVESSHNYPHVDRFFAAVHRVLRPGGYLLMADLRLVGELDEMRQQIIDAGFTIKTEEDITPNVVRSLTLSTNERKELVTTAIPKVLQPAAKDFVGLEGSEVFVAFDTRGMLYTRFVAQRD